MAIIELPPLEHSPEFVDDSVREVTEAALGRAAIFLDDKPNEMTLADIDDYVPEKHDPAFNNLFGFMGVGLNGQKRDWKPLGQDGKHGQFSVEYRQRIGRDNAYQVSDTIVKDPSGKQRRIARASRVGYSKYNNRQSDSEPKEPQHVA